MDELFPLILGLFLGSVLVGRSGPRWIALGATAAATAFFASWSSGELGESWFFLLLDLTEVAAGMMIGLIILRWRRGRSARHGKA